MNDLSRYHAAQALTRQKRCDEARPLFEAIVADGAPGAAEAAYSLAIFYDIGMGIPPGMTTAERELLADTYYRRAEDMGYSMASYYRGVLHYKNGNLQQALDCFRTAAHDNPSAAYWVYRIINDNNRFADIRDDAEKYLSMAADQGHVSAKKIIAVKLIMGRRGIKNIPLGIRQFVRLYTETSRAIDTNEKLRLT